MILDRTAVSLCECEQADLWLSCTRLRWEMSRRGTLYHHCVYNNGRYANRVVAVSTKAVVLDNCGFDSFSPSALDYHFIIKFCQKAIMGACTV